MSAARTERAAWGFVSPALAAWPERIDAFLAETPGIHGDAPADGPARQAV